ncbi:MAG TPA: preprotein translocase subunit SecY [Acholeplasmataceae bacterium]|nr:preprotein translocase subunit SecY [Acholeplasmataceae bacterium]
MKKFFVKNKKIIVAILITFLCLLVWRIGVHITLPLINPDALTGGNQPLFGFLDVFTGGALSQFSVVALGISPYITASIVIQLLQMDIVPIFKEWAEEGEAGKQKLNQVTRYLALFLAFVQGLAFIIGYGLSKEAEVVLFAIDEVTAFHFVYLAIIMTAGSAFILWLSDRISLYGIGNGASMFIVAGIVASFPVMINDLISTFITGADAGGVGDIIKFFIVLIIFILVIVGVVFMEGMQRKIPIQYANRPAAAKFRGKSESNIPIKLNSASVIPVIFAATLMSLPIALLNFTTSTNAFTTWIRRIFNYNEPIGFAIYIILIFLFSFFYSFLQINPEKMAENLQKQNAYVPGVRPGEDTAIYFSRVLFKVTMLGATYLAIVASLPMIISMIFKLPATVQVGGTSIMIVVGVAIETAKQIKTQVQEQEYRGFMD